MPRSSNDPVIMPVPEIRHVYRNDGVTATLLRIKDLKDGDVFSFADRPLEYWRACGAPFRVALSNRHLTLQAWLRGEFTWAINAVQVER